LGQRWGHAIRDPYLWLERIELMAYTHQPAIVIDLWEFAAMFFFIFISGFFYARHKNIMIRKFPEYKYFLWGLYAKIIGGFFFTIIYVYYYGNGDTVSFFNSSIPLVNLALENPFNYFEALFAPNTLQNFYRFFDPNVGYPLEYIYDDDRTYMLVRLISPLTLITFKSMLLTGGLVSIMAYAGVWNLYRTFLRHYPRIEGELAFAVLFFPSVVFWGSGIMKDTFSFSALCWYIYAIDRIFFRKETGFYPWFQALFASLVMVLMKPYIFMMILPASLLWVLYQRVQRFRNSVIRLLLLPIGMILLGALSLTVLSKLEGKLGKFSLGKALDTIVITQLDMKRGEQYGTNYFDLGNIEPTWGSVFSKFPQAVFAGLFRPALNEANNFVMLITALENTFLLLFFIYIVVRSKLVFLIALFFNNPLLQMCYIFSIGCAFMIAITTPNFGAMVRFKIPLLPLFVAALFITSHILDRRKYVLGKGGKFYFSDFSNGDPDIAVRRQRK